MKKVVVLGSLGMAGHMVMLHLKEIGEYRLCGVARQAGVFVDHVLDVSNFSALEEYLKNEKPDVVINCIGALVSHAEKHIASAILLNSYFPHFLSDLGVVCNYKTIHISTDCVFSGKDGQYTEASFRDGDTNYARTKALGELNNERDLTLRTSIIGPELKADGTGLFDFFLKAKGNIQGYNKTLWSGVTTLELAKSINVMLDSQVNGIYHLTNNQPISKYKLLKLFLKYTGNPVEVEEIEGYVSDKTLMNTRQEVEYIVPSYELMTSDMVSYMKAHAELYPHYAR